MGPPVAAGAPRCPALAPANAVYTSDGRASTPWPHLYLDRRWRLAPGHVHVAGPWALRAARPRPQQHHSSGRRPCQWRQTLPLSRQRPHLAGRRHCRWTRILAWAAAVPAGRRSGIVLGDTSGGEPLGRRGVLGPIDSRKRFYASGFAALPTSRRREGSSATRSAQPCRPAMLRGSPLPRLDAVA